MSRVSMVLMAGVIAVLVLTGIATLAMAALLVGVAGLLMASVGSRVLPRLKGRRAQPITIDGRAWERDIRA